jgi:hypothetical protein
MKTKPFWLVSYGVNSSHQTEYLSSGTKGGAIYDTLKEAKKAFASHILVHPFTCKKIYRVGSLTTIVQTEVSK